jgi:NAD(P)-dependent dehydrogenase (short-subunit alcohol dehydrogenase family)
MNRFKDKIVLVTGAASGMGRCHAEMFAAEGAVVVATDVSDRQGREVVAGITAAGHRASYEHHDVSKEADWVRVMATIERDHGHLDILIQNAGWGVLADLEHTDAAAFDKMFAVNACSTFFAGKTAPALMKKAGGGSIIAISSGAAKAASPPAFAYGASKAAICQMVRSLAVVLAPDHIRVNAVLPGLIDTPMSKVATSNPDFLAFMMSRTPLRRVGQPRDVTAAVMFLVSEEASFITGVELPVDGGQLAM